MDSGAQVNQLPYLLELNRFKECPLEPINARKEDPRFFVADLNRDQGFPLGEWDVQRENGVASILNGLPSYQITIGYSPDKKN